MKKKLNYTFHNPNTEKDTIDLLLQVLIEANSTKFERAIQEELQKNSKEIYIEDMEI